VSAPPRTADGQAFRFRADRLCLDLCSTLLWRHRAAEELLLVPDDLARWIHEAGLRPVPAVVEPAALRDAIDLREAVYRAAHARMRREPAAAADRATINRLAAAPVAAPSIDRDGLAARHAAEPAAAALSAVARDAIDLLTGPLADRVRECAADDCAFLFVDTSRPGTRRWCSPTRCGNREHVRDHRRRRRTTRDDAS
jgi:predicted RNA-binding Zn ribbon-like protein